MLHMTILEACTRTSNRGACLQVHQVQQQHQVHMVLQPILFPRLTPCPHHRVVHLHRFCAASAPHSGLLPCQAAAKHVVAKRSTHSDIMCSCARLSQPCHCMHHSSTIHQACEPALLQIAQASYVRMQPSLVSCRQASRLHYFDKKLVSSTDSMTVQACVNIIHRQ